MNLDPRLLDILCCPVTKTPVGPLSASQLAELNRCIAAGGVQTVNGSVIQASIAAGLITTDGKVIYRIDDGIPVMLPEEGIGTVQFSDFPK